METEDIDSSTVLGTFDLATAIYLKVLDHQIMLKITPELKAAAKALEDAILQLRAIVAAMPLSSTSVH